MPSVPGTSAPRAAFRLGVVTDVHLAPAGTPSVAWHNPFDLDGAPRRLAAALASLRGEGADAVAVLGDLAHLGDAASLDAGVRLLEAAGLPVFVVPGNHDCGDPSFPAPGGDPHPVADGARALAASVTRVGARRVRVPGGEGTVVGGGPGEESEVRVAGIGVGRTAAGFAVGGAGAPEVGAWGDGLVVVLAHFPVLSLAAELATAGLRRASDLADRDRVAARLLARRGPTVVLHGHLHVRAARATGTLLQLSCAALVEPPAEAAVVEVATGGGRVVVRRRCRSVAPAAVDRSPVLAPRGQAWTFGAGAWYPGG